MPLTTAVATQLVDYAVAYVRGGRAQVEAYVNSCLRLLLKWRSQQMGEQLIARHGGRVIGGPFKGMAYVSEASEGGLAPRLIGTYESELHPALKALAARGVDRVVDVGCAEGYYAVGLARLLPDARVDAYDVDPRARAACAELARRNGVTDRVRVLHRFDIETVGEVAPRTLVLMDVEGAEADILTDIAPAILRRADLIVETHPGMRPGVTELLAERFAATHEVEVVRGRLKPAPSEIADILPLPLDEFAATWEWRASPTPWLVMRPRAD